jgi:hypothetical protein
MNFKIDPNFKEKAEKYVELGNKLDLEDSEVAFSIMHSSEMSGDEEVKDVLSSLSEVLKGEIHSAIEKYKETGEYYVISSTGTSKDLSKLMKRISALF